MLFARFTFFLWLWLSCLVLIGILCLPFKNPKLLLLSFGNFLLFPNLDAKIDNIKPSCRGSTVQKSITLVAPGRKWLCSYYTLRYISFILRPTLQQLHSKLYLLFWVQGRILGDIFGYLAIKSAPRLRSSSNIWTWPAWKYSYRYIVMEASITHVILLIFFSLLGGVCFPTLAARWIGCSPCESHPVTEVPCSRSKLRISCW